VFTTPAALTLPNMAGYAPGALMDLWSINPVTGEFDNVGTGQVSADGSVINTIEGGIRNSSWHFFNFPPGDPLDPNNHPLNPAEGCDNGKDKQPSSPTTGGSSPQGNSPGSSAQGAGSPGGNSSEDASPSDNPGTNLYQAEPKPPRPDQSNQDLLLQQMAGDSGGGQASTEALFPAFDQPLSPQIRDSQVEMQDGAVVETYGLQSYQSLGGNRGISLTYDSLRADPRQIIHFGYEYIDPSAMVPRVTDRLRLLAKLTISNGSFKYLVPGFAGNQYGLKGGEHIWTVPETRGAVEAALLADLRALPSGQYDYSLETGLRVFVLNQFIGSSSTSSGKITSVNTVNSAFGSGWGIAGLKELVKNRDGSVLMIDGDGSELIFEAPLTPGGAYQSPPGHFEKLEQLADQTFRLTTKDQTVYSFNAQNKLSSVQDSHGNQTRYIYDSAGQITTIIDPVGLETTFTYTNNHVSTITDPVGRVTQMEYDAAGNLLKIINPDNTQQTWEYDAEHHLVAKTDSQGNREQISYDFAGRITQTTDTNGSVTKFSSAQVQGLYRPDATINPLTAPLTSKGLQPETTYVDGNGNTIRSIVDQAGQPVSGVDGEGKLPTIVRDQNLITGITTGNGDTVTFTYDANGNITSQQQTTIFGQASTLTHILH
jgi:YD repeat-containing protein